MSFSAVLSWLMARLEMTTVNNYSIGALNLKFDYPLIETLQPCSIKGQRDRDLQIEQKQQKENLL